MESAEAPYCRRCWEIISPFGPLGLLKCASRDRGSYLYGFAQGLAIFSLSFVSTSEMYRCATSSSLLLVLLPVSF